MRIRVARMFLLPHVDRALQFFVDLAYPGKITSLHLSSLMGFGGKGKKGNSAGNSYWRSDEGWGDEAWDAGWGAGESKTWSGSPPKGTNGNTKGYGKGKGQND